MKLKFRNRIALFNTLAVAFTTALVFVAIYLVVYKTAYAHLDDDILLEKEEVFSNLDWHHDSIVINKMPEWDEAEHNKVEVNPTFLQIVNTNGVVVFHSSNLLKDRFLFNPDVKQGVFYNGEINDQKIRLGQFPIQNDAGAVIGQLTIAVSQQESYVILNNLILVLLISFPLVIFVQFVTSYLAASRAIVPVKELIKTASVIVDSNISSRLEMPHRKDEVYELSTTINDLLDRIEVNIRKQKQFTSDASHEIRTPLAGIRGTLEVLLRKKREPEVYEEKIVEIISQVDRLDKLLDQLLQLARAESGAADIKKETVVLLDFIQELIASWNQYAESNNTTIKIEVASEASIIINRFSLELILDNLVTNAIKYGKHSGNVLINWDPDTRILSVKDDGIGIAEADINHVFDQFFRADESRGSTIKGNGLGLSIAKKIADLQGIRLTVRSEIGSGTVFSLHFPV